MESEFQSAMVATEGPKVIGIPLRPFSMGHRLLLEQIESSFVRGPFPDFTDLIATAFICAHTWQENQMLARSPFRRWLRLKVWGLLAGKFDVMASILALNNYIRTASEFPEVMEKPGEMKQLGAPHAARLYVFLRQLNMSHAEVMDFPLAAANVLYCADAEQAGRLDLVTNTFRNMIRASQGGGK